MKTKRVLARGVAALMTAAAVGLAIGGAEAAGFFKEAAGFDSEGQGVDSPVSPNASRIGATR